MLREMNVVEQRYRAVLEVLSGVPVTEVAERYGVARQTVHRWVARYQAEGIAGLADCSHGPQTASVKSGCGGRSSDLRAAPVPPALGPAAAGVRARSPWPLLLQAS